MDVGTEVGRVRSRSVELTAENDDAVPARIELQGRDLDDGFPARSGGG